MSWSVAAIGKSELVRAEIEKQFKTADQYPCNEPEESVRQAARKLIDASLSAQTNGTAVKVSAAGSQSVNGAVVTNHLSISIEPQYGFVG